MSFPPAITGALIALASLVQAAAAAEPLPVLETGGRGRTAGSVGWSASGQVLAWGDKNSPVLHYTFSLPDLRLRHIPDDQLRAAQAAPGPVQGSFDTGFLYQRSSKTAARLFNQRCGAVLAGDRVVVGGEQLLLYDMGSGKCMQRFEMPPAAILALASSLDNRYFLSASDDQILRVWSPEQKRPLLSLLTAGSDWVAWTPRGYYAASPGGELLLGWQFSEDADRPAPVVPARTLHRALYRPELIQGLLIHGSFEKAWAVAYPSEKPIQSLRELGPPARGKSLPPTVRILSPQMERAVETSQVTLESEAIDQGGGVQGPWLVHNGARLPANAAIKEHQGDTVRCRFTVALVQGENRLEVKAATRDGSCESEPATLTLRYEKPLDRPTLHLVAVGISKYAESGFQLRFARADAEALARLFRERGQTFYREVQVHTLLDEQATGEKIRATLKKVAHQARAQDTLLLFLAGHGTMVGQRYYFIPHEFRTRIGCCRDDDVRAQGVAADVLSEFLASGPARKRMLILDTCASGGAVDQLRVASRNPFAFRSEIERLSRSQGVHVLAAAAATEEAKEPEALGHGVLTYALLAGLQAVDKGPLLGKSVQPAGQEKVVDVLEWFGFAAVQVPRLTREYCGQEQNVYTTGRGSSFPVLPLPGR